MMTEQEKKDMAINHAQVALDQLSRTTHMAMNIVMAFAKAIPKKQKHAKFSDPCDLKKIIRYRKRFNQLTTVHGQLRSMVLKQVNQLP
jgi:hypothetical protein